MVRGKEFRKKLADGKVKVATAIGAVLAGITAIVTFALGDRTRVDAFIEGRQNRNFGESSVS